MSDNTVSQSSLQIPKPTKPPANKALGNSLETLGLAKIQRHLFTYADQPVSQCCSKKASPQASGKYLEKPHSEAQTRPAARHPFLLHR